MTTIVHGALRIIINKRSNGKDKSAYQQNDKNDKSDNSLKKLLQIEAEKEYLKESDQELDRAIKFSSDLKNNRKKPIDYSDEYEVVYEDEMPANNIEIKEL